MCRPGGGTHKKSHVKAYGDYRPNGLVFLQKSLHMGPILVKKILRRGSHFTKIAKKLVKSGIFVVEEPLHMGPDLQKLKKQTNKQTKKKT